MSVEIEITFFFCFVFQRSKAIKSCAIFLDVVINIFAFNALNLDRSRAEVCALQKGSKERRERERRWRERTNCSRH